MYVNLSFTAVLLVLKSCRQRDLDVSRLPYNVDFTVDDLLSARGFNY